MIDIYEGSEYVGRYSVQGTYDAQLLCKRLNKERKTKMCYWMPVKSINDIEKN